MTKTCKMLAAFVVLLSPCALAQQSRQMSIAEMFALADSQNSDIAAAESAVNASRQAVSVARNDRLPQINASLSLSYLGDGTILDRNFGNATRDRLPHFSNTLGLELYQPVYTGGAITSHIKLAEKETEMAVNGRAMSVNGVRMAIATNYLELAKHRNLLRVYVENIDLTERLINEMKARYEQGVVLKNDITRYELRLSSLTYDKLATENAVSIFNNNLVSLLGLEPGTEIVPDIEADGKLTASESQQAWCEQAAANDPTLKSFSIRTDMERLGRRMAQADYIPKVGIVAGDNFLGPVTFEVPAINKNYNAWFVGVNVRWNISSLFTTPKTTRRHDLEIARIRDERSSREDAVNRDIDRAVTLYRQAVARLEIERKNVQLADENYEVVSNRFDNQLALLTDMLDASNARIDAGVRLVNAEISTRYYYYQLHYIAGTLATL